MGVEWCPCYLNDNWNLFNSGEAKGRPKLIPSQNNGVEVNQRWCRVISVTRNSKHISEEMIRHSWKREGLTSHNGIRPQVGASRGQSYLMH